MADAIVLSRRGALAAAISLPMLWNVASAETRGSGRMTAQRLDWAGVRLRVGDIDLFIDVTAPSAEEEMLTSNASRVFALATHHHGDHLDLNLLPSLLGKRGYLVVQKDAARLFDNRVVKMQSVDLFEPVFLSRSSGEFVAWCVPASDGFGSPQVSWVIDGAGRRIIHCGDTLWHGDWWNIARAYGPFDAAFLPINGARQIGGLINDVGQPMMMGPEQAAAAAAALGARLAIPIHYGSSDSPNYIEQPDAEQRFIAAAKARRIAVRVLAPGDNITI